MEVEELVGQSLAGRFELRALIGRGGYGAVFRGIQQPVGRECAVKVLSPELVADDNTVERFRVEAKTTSRLSHPNTVVLYDFGRDERWSVLFLAMELLEGETLREEVREEGPFPPDEAARIVERAAGSLQEAHDAGTVHRDVKPGNVMLTEQGGEDRFVKVIDFGIAKAVREDMDVKKSLTRDGMMVGTPAYMSPEQVQGLEIDGRTDQYALAMTYYFLTTGSAPFQEGTPMQIASRQYTEQPSPLSAYLPDRNLPPEVDEILLTALAKDPEDRFESVEAFATRLSEHLGEESGLVRESADPSRAEPSGREDEDGESTAGDRGRRRREGSAPDTGAIPEETGEGTVAVAPSEWSRDESSVEEGARSRRRLLVGAALGSALLLSAVVAGVVATRSGKLFGSGETSGGSGAVEDGGTRVAQSNAPETEGPSLGEVFSSSELAANGGGSADDASAGRAARTDASAAVGRRAGDREATGSVPSESVPAGSRRAAGGDREAPAGRGKETNERREEPGARSSAAVVFRLIPWGTLYVDGDRVGRGGRVEVDLPPGRHEVTMRKNGEPVVEQTIRVDAGERRNVELAAP